jgi:hypothetical protein
MRAENPCYVPVWDDFDMSTDYEAMTLYVELLRYAARIVHFFVSVD